MSSDRAFGGRQAASRDAALAAYARGDADAGDLLDRALRDAPLDGGLLIARAVLGQERREPDAQGRLAAVLRDAPDWLDGHVALAQLRWGAGDHAGFLEPIEAASRALPRHAGLWMRYMQLLAESGAPGRAADVAARLRREGGDVPALRLIEASHAGAAGDVRRAGALIGTLPADMPGRAAAAARQRLQAGDPDASLPLFDAARRTAPQDIGLWALTELAWRATGDPRHAWLMCDEAVAVHAVDLPDAAWSEVAADLRALHAVRWPPLGQSIRSGTQTRGRLQDRGEGALRLLCDRLQAAVADHVAGLPGADAGHPLLRYRNMPVRLAGAWSIRMVGAGHHVSHVHPAGILSSACHVAVPDTLDATTGEGFLELGCPPRDIRLDIGPVATIRPARPGGWCCFPATSTTARGRWRAASASPSPSMWSPRARRGCGRRPEHHGALGRSRADSKPAARLLRRQAPTRSCTSAAVRLVTRRSSPSARP